MIKSYKLKEVIDFVYSNSELSIANACSCLGFGKNLLTGLLLILEKAGILLLRDDEILIKIQDKNIAEKALTFFIDRNELYQTFQSKGLPFNELLKEATKLKKEKHYIDAYKLLRATIENASKREYLDPRVIVRLPYYLDLNGDLEGALNECYRLFDLSQNGSFSLTEEKINTYSSQFLQFNNIFTSIPILTKMSSILEKQGRFDKALYCETQIYIMLGKYYCYFIEDIVFRADDYAINRYMEIDSCNGEKILIERLKPSSPQPLAYTEKGNPIYDIAYNYILECRDKYLSITNMEKSFRENCYKIGIDYLLENTIQKVKELIINKELTNHEWAKELEYWFEQTVFKSTKNRA